MNAALQMARSAVKHYVDQAKVNGRLQDIALNQRLAAFDIGMTVLAQYVTTGQVTTAMIERWLMEAISSISKGS